MSALLLHNVVMDIIDDCQTAFVKVWNPHDRRWSLVGPSIDESDLHIIQNGADLVAYVEIVRWCDCPSTPDRDLIFAAMVAHSNRLDIPFDRLVDPPTKDEVLSLVVAETSLQQPAPAA